MASSQKRPPSPTLIPNPFIKKRNLEWTLTTTPRVSDTAQAISHDLESSPGNSSSPSNVSISATKHATSTADVEAGVVQFSDHLGQFVAELSSRLAPDATESPKLSIDAFSSLYKENAGSVDGAHFVIHQHDHPVAGTHYDLRLQINETSSVSWAIMYGLPGDPNSIRLNRNATETRIHSLWNHLIETSSSDTGSLLIWDTGVYSVLPRRSKHAPRNDPSSPPGSPPTSSPSSPPPTQQKLLHDAFQNRKIRLRLHGTKLPDPYVLNLRLTKSEDATGRHRSTQVRRSKPRRKATDRLPQPQPETSSEEETDKIKHAVNGDGDDIVMHVSETTATTGDVSGMERELRELEDAQVRLTNAYPGASNTISSIHQRKWYLSLDRNACGFVENRQSGRSLWQLPQPNNANDYELDLSDLGQEESCSIYEHTAVKLTATEGQRESRLLFPFYVRGPEYERSVVTGRRSRDILRDDGITNFVSRKGWTPVLK